ncbi:uncharacterized protein DS421_1g16800 [Arachis hypogaea]|nr:uncharacterized protein DS421_1g16800 [Arachis hypogaea]
MSPLSVNLQWFWRAPTPPLDAFLLFSAVMFHPSPKVLQSLRRVASLLPPFYIGVAAISKSAGLRLQAFSSSPTLQSCQGPHPLLSCANKSPSQLVRSFAVAHQDTNRPHSSQSPRRCRSRSSRRRRSHFLPSLSSPTRLSNLRSLVCAHLVVPSSSIVVSLVTSKH